MSLIRKHVAVLQAWACLSFIFTRWRHHRRDRVLHLEDKTIMALAFALASIRSGLSFDLNWPRRSLALALALALKMVQAFNASVHHRHYLIYQSWYRRTCIWKYRLHSEWDQLVVALVSVGTYNEVTWCGCAEKVVSTSTVVWGVVWSSGPASRLVTTSRRLTALDAWDLITLKLIHSTSSSTPAARLFCFFLFFCTLLQINVISALNIGLSCSGYDAL